MVKIEVSDSTNITLGKYLTTLRTLEELTQQQMASKLHVTRQTVANWESGKIVPNTKTIKELAYFFDIDSNSLFRLIK